MKEAETLYRQCKHTHSKLLRKNTPRLENGNGYASFRNLARVWFNYKIRFFIDLVKVNK